MANKNKLSRKITQDNFVTEKIDVINNNLLGTYDNEGNYTLASQIVDELIKIEKFKKSSFGNSIFCVGNLLGYGELVFELLFDSRTHNKISATATLYLLEEVDKINGYLQNTIKTKIEDFSEEVDDFIGETYKHFNIKLEEEYEEDDDGRERKLLDDLENEDSFILAKKQYSLLLQKLLDEKFLDAYGKYFTYRISSLTKLDNEFSQTVLNNFNSQYALIENVFLQEKNYKMLNELLDKCIEEISDTNDLFTSQEKEFIEKTQPALDNFVDSVNKLNYKFEHKALNMLDKSDRQKVEEILDEHHEQESVDYYESKPSVDQMVNDVPKTIYTIQEQKSEVVKDDTELVEEQPPKEKAVEEKIQEEPKRSEKQEENIASQQQASTFYSAFKENYTKQQPQSNEKAKVVDTSISSAVENHATNEERAATSLKDRITRLSKFKESPIIDSTNTGKSVLTSTSRMGSLVENLYRERSIKDEQIDRKNKLNREEIESIQHNELDMER